MQAITVYRHGGTGGIRGRGSNHVRAKRGEVQGWSPAAVRRNTAFLMQVDERLLTGHAVALTLTLKDCPPDAREWHRLRRAWTDRMRRAGMVRLHWVTEWQRRGVPHLHVALWVSGDSTADPIGAWLDLAEKFGAGRKGQHQAPITGAVGWFQYLAKHAARGVRHYQRAAENIPEGWKSKTGRVWGSSGDWPCAKPRQFGFRREDHGYWRFRRMVRAWRRADARAAGDRWRIKSARRMLRHGKGRSELMGWREWMPADGVQLQMLALLAQSGHEIVELETGELITSAVAFSGSER